MKIKYNKIDIDGRCPKTCVFEDGEYHIYCKIKSHCDFKNDDCTYGDKDCPLIKHKKIIIELEEK